MHSWFTLLSLSLKQFQIRENRRETPSLLWRPTIYDRLRQAALDKKCLVLVVTMATIFLLCWLPWYIVMLLYRIMNDVKELEIPAHVFVLVRYATSVTNPVLYTLFTRDFRSLRSSDSNGAREQAMQKHFKYNIGTDNKWTMTSRLLVAFQLCDKCTVRHLRLSFWRWSRLLTSITMTDNRRSCASTQKGGKSVLLCKRPVKLTR